MQGYIFCSSRGMTFKENSFFGIFVFSLWHKEHEPFLGGFAPPATGRTTAVFSMVLDLFFPEHCVHKDTARYVLSYSKPFELLSKLLALIGKLHSEVVHFC